MVALRRRQGSLSSPQRGARHSRPGGVHPARDGAVPVGYEPFPAREGAIPARYQAIPLGDEAFPPGEGAIPARYEAIPTGEGLLPKEKTVGVEINLFSGRGDRCRRATATARFPICRRLARIVRYAFKTAAEAARRR